MSKFTFICEEEPMPFADAVSSKRTVDIVNEFEMFLKGCGFNFEGRLDLVQEEHEWVQDKRADQEFDYR